LCSAANVSISLIVDGAPMAEPVMWTFARLMSA
jgi:hypothetical protein